MRLIICEKPSVGMTIASVCLLASTLCPFPQQEGSSKSQRQSADTRVAPAAGATLGISGVTVQLDDILQFLARRDRRKSRNQNAYYIRGTYTGSNLDFFEDIIHMADMGFKELSMEPVVTDDNAVYAIKKENLPQIYEQRIKMKKKS